MHHLCLCFQGHFFLSKRFVACQALLRLFVLHQIKPHVLIHYICGPYQFLWVSFLWTYSLGGILNVLTITLHTSICIMFSIHRLWLGLLEYLIPFDPVAFVSQCQCQPNRMSLSLVFFLISMHFIVPLEIPFSPTIFQLGSFHYLSKVKPWDLTMDLRKITKCSNKSCTQQTNMLR